MRIIRCLAALVSGLLVYPPAVAQFPKQAIEITVPFGAGNAADVTARHLANGMAKRLGVAVPVVNRPGGGAVAFTHVQQQKPDGYTLGYITSTISTNYYSGIIQGGDRWSAPNTDPPSSGHARVSRQSDPHLLYPPSGGVQRPLCAAALPVPAGAKLIGHSSRSDVM
jgi:hypothetical protein